MMKKRIIGIIVIGAIVFMTFKAGMAAGAASSTPGTTSDPLITQSYLEKRLKEVNGGSQSTVTKAEEVSYKKISVTKGKQLIVGEGSEFVLYSGSGSILGSKGIMSLSEGKLLKKGSKTSVYKNYLSLSLTSGIKATENCIIYVKGNYTIKG